MSVGFFNLVGSTPQEIATVVEELYIAALLHAEDQWDLDARLLERHGVRSSQTTWYVVGGNW